MGYINFCWGIGFSDPQIEEDISQSFTGFTVDGYIYMYMYIRSVPVQINLYIGERDIKHWLRITTTFYNCTCHWRQFVRLDFSTVRSCFLLATPTINASYATPHQDVHGDLECFISLRLMSCWLLAYLGSFSWICYQFNPIYARNLFTPSHTHHALVENKTPKTPKFEVI